MPQLDELDKLAEQLVRGRLPKELQARIHAAHHRLRFAEEDAKPHELDDYQFKNFPEFCNHMLDGGGVLSHKKPLDSGQTLAQMLHTCLADHDEKSFLHMLPHYIKATLSEAGLRSQVGEGTAAVVQSAKHFEQIQTATHAQTAGLEAMADEAIKDWDQNEDGIAGATHALRALLPLGRRTAPLHVLNAAVRFAMDRRLQQKEGEPK